MDGREPLTADDAPIAAPADEAALDAAWEAEGEAIRDELREVQPFFFLALLPLGLVVLLLSVVLGEWVWVLMPLGFAGIVFAPWFLAVWRRHESGLPLVLPGGRVLEGAAKRRVLRIAGIGIPAVLALGFLGERLTGRGLAAIREVLWDWTIPWSALGL